MYIGKYFSVKRLLIRDCSCIENFTDNQNDFDKLSGCLCNLFCYCVCCFLVNRLYTFVSGCKLLTI